MVPTSAATRLEPPQGRDKRRAGKRTALRRASAGERQHWLGGAGRALRPKISAAGGRGGLREGAGSRSSPTIRKVPPSRSRRLSELLGVVGNTPLEIIPLSLC